MKRYAAAIALAGTLVCASRPGHAESLAGDPDATADLGSGRRNTRGRMDKLDVDFVDLYPKIGDKRAAMMGLALGYRVLPELTTGVYFDATLFGAAADLRDACHATDDCYARHFRFGSFVQMHFGPNSSIDPWITLAAGASTYHRFGADVSAMIGLDLRLGDVVAIGPMFTRTQSIAGGQPSWNAFGAHMLFTF